MGQQTSRDHSPLTFGYVNHDNNNTGQRGNTTKQDANSQLEQDANRQLEQDFVLANPHLYQLQTICKQCNSTKYLQEQVVVSLVGESCSKCQSQKRLSLVRRDLADDLEYIDQTYYPDLVHYNNNSQEDPMEAELLELEKDDNVARQWSRLTIGEATTEENITTTSRPRRLTGPSMAVDLSNRSLIKLSPSIGHLNTLTKLNLSNNQMTSLPRELGYLKNLRVLNVSNNAIEELPDTVAFLLKLKALNVANNKLTQLPSSIGNLPKLVIVVANNNSLVSLPKEISNLKNLISLNVSNNPLKSLPAEIANLTSLRKLLTDECPFEEEYAYELKHNPPSLLETCARMAIRMQSNIPSHLPDHIKEYLARSETCSHCKGPYFESYMKRVRFIERRTRQTMALEYRLCSSHWTTENDRLLNMFSTNPTLTTISKHNIDMDGLNNINTPGTCRRTNSNSSYSSINSNSRSFITSPIITTPSSPLARSAPSDYFSYTDTIPISSLRNIPNLPALQQESNRSFLQSSKGNRPRASSAASVTKRFTNFIRSSSSSSALTVSRRERSTSSASNSSTTSLPIRQPTPHHSHLSTFETFETVNNNAPDSTSSSSSSSRLTAELLAQQPQQQLQQKTKRAVLKEWTDSIQVATAAAEVTLASQQEEIERLVTHGSNNMHNIVASLDI